MRAISAHREPSTISCVHSSPTVLFLCHTDWWAIPSLLCCQRTRWLWETVSSYTPYLHTCLSYTWHAAYKIVFLWPDVLLCYLYLYLSLLLCKFIELHAEKMAANHTTSVLLNATALPFLCYTFNHFFIVYKNGKSKFRSFVKKIILQVAQLGG